MNSMKVTAYKTKKVVVGDDLYKILDDYLPKLKDKTVVAVSSKIVGICEGRVDPDDSDEHRDEVAKKEAEFYIPTRLSQYDFMITINHNLLVARAGIDHSNGHGNLVLWPKDPQKSVNQIREYLVKKHGLKNLGVILTDSHLSPLRWGVTGVSIAHSGFETLIDYVGTPDIFGRLLKVEKSNVADSLATAAVIEMGEGNEQQPIGIIEDAKFVKFQERNPTEEELAGLRIKIEEDVFAPFLTAAKWIKGGR